MANSVDTEIEILRKGLPEAKFDAVGDPRNVGWAHGLLVDWLRSNGWAQSRWPEFELLVREKRGWTVRSRVRA